ncbi:MAG: alginate export family protein [Nitrospinae bacterium]|nr:alginate export family protein [Nitrospinota bacterium]
MDKGFRIFVAACAVCIALFGFLHEASAIRLHEMGSVWDLHISPEVRLSYNTVNNTGDLKGGDNDKLDYAAYTYKIPIHLKYKAKSLFFINILSEGPSHYAAPLQDLIPAIEGAKVTKSGGVESILYPGVNEVWLKVYPFTQINLQIGQAPYTVGNSYAIGGQYNNYGVTVAYEYSDKIKTRLRYSILDFENKLYEIRPDTFKKWGLGRSYDSDAYLLAAYIKLKVSNHTFQPYIGYFYDQTPLSKRKQHGYFTNAAESFAPGADRIYTIGLNANLEFSYITIEFEGIKNSGETESGTKGWGNIKHEGYLIHANAKGHLGVFTPRIKMVAASGNKVDTGDPARFTAGTLRRTENSAFTVFSPLNTNLVDSYAHKATVPVVAMAGGYSMNYGIRRPGTYNDPHVWENIITYNAGLSFAPADEVFLMLDYWKLSAMEAGIGQKTVNGPYEYLSKDLGDEVDIYGSYSLTKTMTIGLHGGYFLPGGYYKTVRADSENVWNNNMSQTARADGSADNAYQMELFFTYKF